MKRLFVILGCAALGMLRAAEPTAAELNQIVGTPLFGEAEAVHCRAG